MAMDGYSRTVSFLKVMLPLFALGLLSTLFLLSRAVDLSQSIPFAEPEIQSRLLNQQVTAPYYAGMSADGDEITFVAETVTTPGDLDGAKTAKQVEANFKMASGTVIDVTSNSGTFDLARDASTLTGQVVISTSTGIVVRSEHLDGKMSTLDIRSPDRVTGVMLGGDLDAGSMILTAPERGAPADLLFQKGVKLIYLPKEARD